MFDSNIATINIWTPLAFERYTATVCRRLLDHTEANDNRRSGGGDWLREPRHWSDSSATLSSLTPELKTIRSRLLHGHCLASKQGTLVGVY